MGDFGPVIVAVITTVGTLAAAYIGGRRYTSRRTTGASLAESWRRQAELEKARADLNAEERDREHAARIAAEQTLATTRHDLDDCARQLDGARSDYRALERRRRPRPESTE